MVIVWLVLLYVVSASASAAASYLYFGHYWDKWRKMKRDNDNS